MSDKQDLKQSEASSVSEFISDEIIDPTIDLSIEYGEILLDSFIENDGLAGIPVLSTIRGLNKLSNSVQNAHFTKKLFTFLKELHNGTIDDVKLEEFKKKLHSEKNFREKVVEHIMIYIERAEDTAKAKILAKLLNAHIEGKFNWSTYCDLSASIDRLHPFAIKELHNKNSDEIININEQAVRRATQSENLQTNGPGFRVKISPTTQNFLSSAGLGYKETLYYKENNPQGDTKETNCLLSPLGTHLVMNALDYGRKDIRNIDGNWVLRVTYSI